MGKESKKEHYRNYSKQTNNTNFKSLKTKKMKKYNYYNNGQVIPKSQFIEVVPDDWEKEVVNGEYSYGYYRAIEREENKTYFVEVEKALDWEAGYLNWDGKVVTNFKEANDFDNKEDAEEAAALFNIEHGTNGRIYARVR